MLTLLSPLRVIVTFFCLSLLLSACGPGQAKSKPHYHLVQGDRLQLEEQYTATRKFVGNVEAKQKVDLAFELPGTVLSVLVDEGDRVSAGQILMSLDTRLLEDERKQLLALKEEIIAKQKLVALQIERQQRLQQRGLAAQQQRDELDAQSAGLAAQLNHQKSRLSAVAVRLSQSVIKAPYDAHISARYFDEGAVVNSGQPVLQLLDQASLEARVGVPAKLARSLEVYSSSSINSNEKTQSTVVVSLPDQTIANASVIAVGQVIDPTTRTVSVRLALPEALGVVDGDLLFLNMPETYQQPGFWVPLSALSGSIRGMWNLMILVPAESKGLYILEARSVELLHRANGKVFVRGSVAESERYVVSGLHTMVIGQMVRVHLPDPVVAIEDGV